MTAPLDWRDMRERSADLLRRQTGESVETWNARVREAAPTDERGVRAWLDERGVSGYAQALLVWERFGYPDFMTSSAGELIDAQYADRPGLRPVLDALLEQARALGEDVEVQARKGFVTLVARRTFAVIRATTRTRVDLGLRLMGAEPDGGRMLPAGAGLGAATVRVALTSPAEVDGAVVDLLRCVRREPVAVPDPE